MASRTINTILNLQDKMSPKLIQVSKKVKGLDKDTQRASQRMANMANKFGTSVNQMVSKSVKFAAIGASLASIFAVKAGFSEAMDLEGYRMQLETATKDTKKAADIMRYSIKLANATPFEGGELVEGASKLEAMGMSAKRWLPKIGDMAAATNKSFDQAVEAVIDAQAGELERLKEFGITKAKIADKANKMFAGQEIINNKGQIVNQKKFNEAMVAVMQERFTGGMEKQSKTIKGLWSTVTGVTKSALATMVGMQQDGTIKSGSMMDKLKIKVKMLGDKLTQWQSDGTLDRLGKKFTQVFTTIYNAISKVYNFFKKYHEIIIFIGTFVVALSGIISVLSALTNTFKLFQFIVSLTNGTLALCPLMWIVAGIAAVIAIGVLLVRNWNEITKAVSGAWKWFRKVLDGLPNFALLLAGPIAPLLLLIKNFDKVRDAIKGAWRWFKKFNDDSASKKTITPVTKGSKVSTQKPNTGTNKLMNGIALPHNALGTSYWKGGLSLVGERGPELVNMPGGAKVSTTSKTDKMLNKKGSNVFNININGVGKSTDEILNEFVPKLKLAIANL